MLDNIRERRHRLDHGGGLCFPLREQLRELIERHLRVSSGDDLGQKVLLVPDQDPDVRETIDDGPVHDQSDDRRIQDSQYRIENLPNGAMDRDE